MITLKYKNKKYPLFSRKYLKLDKPVMVGFILLFLFNALDIITTYFAIGLGGYEANPFMKPIIQAGLLIAIIVKLLSISIIGIILLPIIAMEKNIGVCGLYSCIGGVLEVVIANIGVILQLTLGVFR